MSELTRILFTLEARSQEQEVGWHYLKRITSRDLWPGAANAKGRRVHTGERCRGFKRRGKADKARVMNIAEGSLEESRYYLILAHDLGYGRPQEGRMNLLEEVSRLLNAYAKAILASGF